MKNYLTLSIKTSDPLESEENGCYWNGEKYCYNLIIDYSDNIKSTFRIYGLDPDMKPNTGYNISIAMASDIVRHYYFESVYDIQEKMIIEGIYNKLYNYNMDSASAEECETKITYGTLIEWSKYGER